jgi:hypothetical protein
MKTNEENAPYAVIACRWGWINNGFSVMCVTNDLEKAKREADEYADYRGGKYGVGVFDASGKQVYHSASLHGEKELHINHRIDAFESVGCHVYCELESGKDLNVDKIKERYDDAVRTQKIMVGLDEKPR